MPGVAPAAARQRAFTSALAGVVTNVIALVLTVGVMATLSWQVTVLAVVLLPTFLIPARRVGAKVGALEREAAADGDPGILQERTTRPHHVVIARHQPVLPVLITFTLRNLAGGQPWLTEFTCPGSPFPSLKVPPSQ